MTIESAAEAPTLDSDLGLNPDFVRRVVEALDADDTAAVRALVDELAPPDVADLLAVVRPHERSALLQMLGSKLDPEVLPELDEEVRDQVLEELPSSAVVAAVQELDSDDAIYLLEDLPKERQDEILARVPAEERTAVELGLRSEEGTAGRLMQREFITVPSYWSVGQTIDYLRETPSLPDEFYEIFVVDAGLHPIGTVRLSQIMRSRRPVMIGDIMEKEPHLVPIDMDQREIAYLFDQYNLVSAAVVDQDQRIIGMLTVDDIVDVISQEAQEDMFALSGVSDESISDNFILTTRRRFSWLFVNLLTAILASAVIALFSGTIEKVVALAALTPIVASMGGNAGTQTLTVAVRALATKELSAANALRIIWREALVGSINGLLFALIVVALVGLWLDNFVIALVAGIAMIINLIAAGLAGILVPLTLRRFGADPAISSAVFVTTVTDCTGFFVFLGLATWVLIK
ncbi:MAG: magnesium transporter [Alphaproteobacteria bacterium]